MTDPIPVLGCGYVRYVDHLGSDLTVCNAARASFAKESAALGPDDERLIRYLAAHQHESPFRHCALTVEFKAPLLVARQLFRYVVAACHTEDQQAWSEQSRRYVTAEPEFYVPEVWRAAPESRKQGSGPGIPEGERPYWSRKLRGLQRVGLQVYEEALAAGICPEQARLFLPAYALLVTWRSTLSLQAVVHLVRQRREEDAQAETRAFVGPLEALLRRLWPVSVAALLGEPE